MRKELIRESRLCILMVLILLMTSVPIDLMPIAFKRAFASGELSEFVNINYGERASPDYNGNGSYSRNNRIDGVEVTLPSKPGKVIRSYQFYKGEITGEEVVLTGNKRSVTFTKDFVGEAVPAKLNAQTAQAYYAWYRYGKGTRGNAWYAKPDYLGGGEKICPGGRGDLNHTLDAFGMPALPDCYDDNLGFQLNRTINFSIDEVKLPAEVIDPTSVVLENKVPYSEEIEPEESGVPGPGIHDRGAELLRLEQNGSADPSDWTQVDSWRAVWAHSFREYPGNQEPTEAANPQIDDLPAYGARIMAYYVAWRVSLQAVTYQYSNVIKVNYEDEPVVEKPDLEPTGITASGCIGAGTSVTYKYSIVSNGQPTTQPFAVEVQADGSVINTFNYANGLAKDSPEEGTFTHTFSSAGSHSLTLKVDLGNDVDEGDNEGNNILNQPVTVQSTCGSTPPPPPPSDIPVDLTIEKSTLTWKQDNLFTGTYDDSAAACKAGQSKYIMNDGDKGHSYSTGWTQDPKDAESMIFAFLGDGYYGGIGSGTVWVTYIVQDECGKDHFSPPKTFVIGPQSPPTIKVGWAMVSNPTVLVDSAFEGDSVVLRVFQYEGTLQNWDFNDTDWVKSLPSTYGWGVGPYKGTQYGPVTASVKGTHMFCVSTKNNAGTGSGCGYLTVKSKNPIPVITGATSVKEGRTVIPSWSAASSYSPVAGRTINHALDEWTGKQDVYFTPGDQTVTLEVTDSNGLKSLPENKAIHIINVIPDAPPEIAFAHTNVLTRGTTNTFQNQSYSPDGDSIRSYEVTYGYDSSNNGACTPSTMISSSNAPFIFKPDKVGKYCFKVSAVEDTPLAKSAVKVYIVEVINDGPTSTFTVSGEIQEPMPVESHGVSAATMAGWKNTNLDFPTQANRYQVTSRNTLLSGSPIGDLFPAWNYAMLYGNSPVITSSKSLRVGGLGNDGDDEDPIRISKVIDSETVIGTRHANGWANDYLLSPNFDPKPLGQVWTRYFMRPDLNEMMRIDYYSGAGSACTNMYTRYSYYLYRISDLHNGNVSPKAQSVKEDWGGRSGCYTWEQGSVTTYSDGSKADYHSVGAEPLEGKKVENGAYYHVSRSQIYPYATTMKVTNWGESTSQTADITAALDGSSCSVRDNHRLFMLRQTVNSKAILMCSSFERYSNSDSDLLKNFLNWYEVDANGTVTKIDGIVSSNYHADSTWYQYNIIKIFTNKNQDLYKIRVWTNYEWPERNALNLYLDKDMKVIGTSKPWDKEEPTWNIEDQIAPPYGNGQLKMQPYGDVLLDGYTINKFTYNFDQGDTNERYDNGSTSGTPLGKGQLIGNISLSNFGYRSKVKAHNTILNALPFGLSFRIQDHKNMYRVSLMKDFALLYKIQNGRKVELKRVGIYMQQDKWYDLKVVAIGTNIKVYFGGGLIVDLEDSTFAAGTFGPYAERTGIEFTNTAYEIYPDSASTAIDGIVLVDKEAKYVNTYSDPENDPAIPPLAKWTYSHTDTSMFLNSLSDGKVGLSARNGQTVVSPYAVFDKVGLYRIDYQISDDPHPDHRYPDMMFDNYRKYSPKFSRNLVVHRQPISIFTAFIDGSNMVAWTDSSYDPDRCYAKGNCQTGYETDSGIRMEKYYYITPSGTTVHGKLTKPTETGTYTLGKTVRDEYSAWSDWATQSLEVTVALPNTPPTVTLIFPTGTQSSPTPVTLKPTVSWNQADSDPGTTFAVFNLMIKDEFGNCVECLSNRPMNTMNGSWSWTMDALLVTGTKYSVQVQVSDGNVFSEWSNIGWMITNRPPEAYMSNPWGTQDNPTIMNTVRPALTWTQTDPDPGTTFTYFHMQVADEGNTSVVADSGQVWQGTTSSAGIWNGVPELPAGYKLRTRVRVTDGFLWSPWSPDAWLLINRAPTAAMAWPWSTSAANPNVTNEAMPTMRWVQHDADPGAQFAYYQVQVVERWGAVLADSGMVWQGTAAGEGSWTPSQSLPRGRPLMARVQIWDQYGAGSGWSSATWLYVNQAPAAAFDWSPNPAYEGDEVQLTNRSTDADGDTLQAEWRLTGPGYDETGTSWNAVIPAASTDHHPGAWTVTLRVTDAYGLTDQVSRIIPIGDLTLQASVLHTERWEENRRSYNLRHTGDPELPRGADWFWAGEAFVLKALTNEPAESVEARMSYTELTTSLRGSTEKTGWSGAAYREEWELLPDGAYTFVFTARYPNGHVETAVQAVRVVGSWAEYTSSVRKE